ncbi:MAG: UDP-N-acetylmuramate:L-alanyl-gamma-D-glutamyl-meso-diaminopimelate ligase [Deltaproteobacteria bacterium]|nr:MAG: UDP-N-acetylmuramate:L-alanyl-gamma-D-glutamyl-meso-diaminopimelate ligase [Deltaproteobacteria bacterium]
MQNAGSSGSDLPRIERIHIIGICGVATGSLAGMLQARGYRVTGSDLDVYPPMSTQLEHLGIPILPGFSPDHLDPPPDLVIVGNVASRRNPEVVAVMERGIPYLSMPEALARFFLGTGTSIVIAGTHGKTTTSALAAWTLEVAGLDPGFMIGGIVKNFGKSYKIGGGNYFVTEGDEYDTAFFDKGPKFLHYRPRIGIVTSIEFDHADIFPDFEAVKGAFARFIDLLPPEGRLIVAHEDPTIAALLPRSHAPVLSYGLTGEADYVADEIEIGTDTTRFVVRAHNHPLLRIETPLFGLHNVRNALAVIAMARQLEIPQPAIEKAMATFAGVARRQEVRGVVRGVTVIDDFAHHPSAIRETIGAVRRKYAGQRLFAVFEPRSNTTRRNVFQEAFVEAFSWPGVEVVIADLFSPEKIPPPERLCVERLVQDLQARGIHARHIPTAKEIVETLARETKEGDVVLIMSNGGFDDIHRKLLIALHP